MAGWRKAVLVAVISAMLIWALLIWHNSRIETTELEYISPRLPQGFDGCRILQVSDLHNNRFGKGQSRLLAAVAQARPDYIFLTGDMIDRKAMEYTILFAKGAVEIAPVYYVPGNHEAWHGVYDTLRSRLKAAGVTVLDNRHVTLRRGDDAISLLGIQDPAFFPDTNAFTAALNQLSQQAEQPFKVLLCHRPEYMQDYWEAQIDLVFTGHVHGGGVRIPGVGALYGPDQGFLPQYSSGVYTQDHTTMVVSRGLGNNLFPLRMFNAPELVLFTLKHEGS